MAMTAAVKPGGAVVGSEAVVMAKVLALVLVGGRDQGLVGTRLTINYGCPPSKLLIN